MAVETENFIENRFEGRESQITGAILLLVACLSLIDISVDISEGVELDHILIEALIIPITAFGLVRVWVGLRRSYMENRILRTDLAKVANSAAEWKKEASRYVIGLSDSIDDQLTRWGLTAAEKEVALLLLKGLSHKEIAAARDTSERTARQQALAVYAKSDLGGRAELAAFFLEDLLSPAPRKDGIC